MQTWGHIRNVLLCFLAAAGAGLLLCRFWGMAPARALWYGCTGLLGGLTGAAAFHGNKRRGILCLALAVLGALGFSIFGVGTVFGLFCGLAMVLLTFGAMTAGGYGFYGPLGVWSVVLLGVSALLAKTQLWQAIAMAGALLALGLTLDGFRDSSLRRSHLQGKDVPLGADRELRRHSLWLFGLFILGAIAGTFALMGVWALISETVKALFHFLLTGTGAFGLFLAQILERFMHWLLWLLSLLEPDSSGYDGDSEGYHWDLEPYDGGSPGSTLILVILIVCGVAALVATIGIAILRRKPRKKRLQADPRDYEDTIERLERPKRKKFRWPWQHWEERRQYQGNMKIRYAFQQMLKRRRKTDPMAGTKTPNELRRDFSDENALIDAYNHVRYGGGEATAEELSAAEQILNKK